MHTLKSTEHCYDVKPESLARHPVSLVGSVSMVKRAIRTRSWTVTAILSTAFLAAIDELQLKRMCNTQKLRIAKTVFKKKK